MKRKKEQAQKDQVGNNKTQKKESNEELKDSFLETIIGLGINGFMEYVEEEITSICGERYSHLTNREFTRWSTKDAYLIFGGRKIKVTFNRVRNIQMNQEQELETIKQYQNKELLNQRQMEQMMLGVSTRNYIRSLETGSSNLDTLGDSKSSVSRNFIVITAKKLDKWLNDPITEKYECLMIDGIVFKETTVLVALGIKGDGSKKVLGALEGSTENSKVCKDLLTKLRERGLDISAIKLVVIDGSKAIKKALYEVIGKNILIQRCQIHKKRNVEDYLPQIMREPIRLKMNEAYSTFTYEEAKKMLISIKKSLEEKYPQAARSLEEGLEETLTLHKLGAHVDLRKSLATTNVIESLNNGIKNKTKRVKCWKNSDMVIRWVCAGIIESEKNFRKINGHEHLKSLLETIDSLNSNEKVN